MPNTHPIENPLPIVRVPSKQEKPPIEQILIDAQTSKQLNEQSLIYLSSTGIATKTVNGKRARSDVEVVPTQLVQSESIQTFEKEIFKNQGAKQIDESQTQKPQKPLQQPLQKQGCEMKMIESIHEPIYALETKGATPELESFFNCAYYSVFNTGLNVDIRSHSVGALEADAIRKSFVQERFSLFSNGVV